MRQEVNLYTHEFVPRRQWCTFTQAIAASVVFFLVMGGYSLKLYQQLLLLKEENLVLVEKTEGIETGNASMGLMDRIVEKKELLERQVENLSKEVENKKRVKGVYEIESDIKLASFYRVFVDIAEYSNSNLAIDEIGIYDGGEEVVINGLSRLKPVIPQYLTRLQAQASFEGSRFGLLKIERIKENGFYQFSMNRNRTGNNDAEDNTLLYQREALISSENQRDYSG